MGQFEEFQVRWREGRRSDLWKSIKRKFKSFILESHMCLFIGEKLFIMGLASKWVTEIH